MVWLNNKKRQPGLESSGPIQPVLEDSTGSNHIIEVVGINKFYGDAHVLKDVTFYIRNNEFITLLGPSG